MLISPNELNLVFQNTTVCRSVGSLQLHKVENQSYSGHMDPKHFNYNISALLIHLSTFNKQFILALYDVLNNL